MELQEASAMFATRPTWQSNVAVRSLHTKHIQIGTKGCTFYAVMELIRQLPIPPARCLPQVPQEHVCTVPKRHHQMSDATALSVNSGFIIWHLKS